VPGGLTAALQPLRFRKLRRLPMLWSALSKRPVPDDIMDGWFGSALTRREIRRDLRKYVRSVPPKNTLLEWAERQRAFGGPVLIVWAPEDRIMPPEHGRRLAELFPEGRLVEIPDTYTLIPEDRPAELTTLIREFVPSRPNTTTERTSQGGASS
jgi:pimeloyl-ACP methyl ester carboxylesterase